MKRHDHEQWMKLIVFIEKDLKLQQQRMWIQEKSDEKRNIKQNLYGRQSGTNGPHFTNQITEKKCHFCYEIDNHIATAGPRETNYSVFHLQKICWNDTKRKGFKSSEAKDIVFNVYSLEYHRAQTNTNGK